MSRIIALKQNSEFHRAYARGKSCASPELVTYAFRSRLRGSGCRVGITTSKKIGSAVERNRCRRVIRAAWSSLDTQVTGDWDIVFVARHKTKILKTPAVASAMSKQLTQLGVIRKT